jgi:hypothetical protein
LTETLNAAPSGTRKTPERPCLNCGDPTPGNFCRNCGQRKIEVRVSLRGMLLEALDDQFSLNSALPRTIAALFFRPGRLTRDYMDGRIARYIPPFRLYLVSSLLFFLILSFDLRMSGGTGQGVQVRVDSTETTPAPPRGPGSAPDSAVPRRQRNWLGAGRSNTGWAELDSIVNARTHDLGEMEPQVAMQRVAKQFLEYVPQTMFIILPLFAAVLKLLYLRRRRLYVEHFVFALHLHAFTFMMIALTLIIPGAAIEVAAMLWIMVYTYLAMYRVYGQGVIGTAVKYLTLGMIYTILLSFALISTLLVVLVLM